MLNWVKNDTAVYQNLNWSQSFPSVLNSNSYPGPGINKSQCQDHCGQYSFSMRPERNDFALIRVGLTISTVLSEFWNTGAPEFPCQKLTGKKIHLTGKEYFSLSNLFFPVRWHFSLSIFFFPVKFWLFFPVNFW